MWTSLFPRSWLFAVTSPGQTFLRKILPSDIVPVFWDLSPPIPRALKRHGLGSPAAMKIIFQMLRPPWTQTRPLHHDRTSRLCLIRLQYLLHLSSILYHLSMVHLNPTMVWNKSNLSLVPAKSVWGREKPFCPRPPIQYVDVKLIDLTKRVFGLALVLFHCSHSTANLLPVYILITNERRGWCDPACFVEDELDQSRRKQTTGS